MIAQFALNDVKTDVLRLRTVLFVLDALDVT